MIKTLVKSAIAGTCLMAMVTAANAAEYNVNIYGASAQYKFWTTAAPEFLASQGCATADIYTAASEADDTDHGIAWCAGSTGIGGVTGNGMNNDGNDYIIRYSANASYDGVMAVQDDDSTMPELDATRGCTGGERLMADETDISWVGYGTDPESGTVNTTACKDVVVGASDVAAETFNQTSTGALEGHLGGDVVTRNITGFSIDLDNYNADRPIVVPFAFFANADETTPVPFDNLSRLMVTSIYSGQILNWNEFDPTADSLPMVICLRHAGSGTHATLDAAVMRGDAALLKTEVNTSSFLYQMGLAPLVWFNAGSSDMMRCVGQQVGAVGYADADKNAGQPVNDGKYGDIKTMTWMGVEPVKANIVNGQYDFWSNQWLYSSKGETTQIATMIDALASYASDPANMPSARAAYWAAEDEMMVGKATDFAYPKFK